MKETFGLCEGRGHSRESISIPVRIWLVNSALDSVESRMNCADDNHVTGLLNYLLDTLWYRVDSRWVTIEGLGTLLNFLSSPCFQLSGWLSSLRIDT